MVIADEIAGWIGTQVKASGAEGAVFGLSGGMDSAVVAGLCRRALGKNLLGLIMPCHSLASDREDAELVAKVFDLPTMVIELDRTYDALVSVLPPGGEMARSNLKPRLRMCVLYYMANEKGYLVVGTGNLSERMVGYFTKHGDGAADIYPIGGIYKTEIMDLARELGVPERIIGKPPSAGLWEGQTDEGEMGIGYPDLDSILKSLDRGDEGALHGPLADKVRLMVRSSEHKRCPGPVYEPSERRGANQGATEGWA